MNKLFLFTLLFLGFITTTLSQPVPEIVAHKTAVNRIYKDNKLKSASVDKLEILSGYDGTTIGYFYHLSPQGFIIVSGRYELPPVIAYSYSNNPDNENRIVNMVTIELSNQINNLSNYPDSEKNKIINSWKQIDDHSVKGPKFQQWPPSGTTASEGWLTTQWDQIGPYNLKCPLDPVDGIRSLAGCPALAMAQIINFHRTIHHTTFSDNDDYYHSFQGINYYIDDDYDSLDFPSFPELNSLMDSIQKKYQSKSNLNIPEKAALVFACGVASQQFYTSTGSGVFGLFYLINGFLKFNYNDVILINHTDTSIFSHVVQNVIDTLPVHFTVFDSAWTTGHCVVVDGYNTDNFYHINFGWGGGADGWYLLPAGFPLGLNRTKAAIVDIIPPIELGISMVEKPSVSIFPNPSDDIICFSLPENSKYNAGLFTIQGQCIIKSQNCGANGKLDASSLPSGSYILQIEQNSQIFHSKVIIR